MSKSKSGGESRPTTFTGFTIVETLIVLAVAGFIILLVFYAVPALRRNSNNNSRRHDASMLAGLVNEYIASHGGKLPSTFGTSPNELNLSNTYWAIVNPPELGTINTTTAPQYGDINTLIINNGFACQNNQMSLSSGSIFTIGFSIEASGGFEQTTCLQG